MYFMVIGQQLRSILNCIIWILTILHILILDRERVVYVRYHYQNCWWSEFVGTRHILKKGCIRKILRKENVNYVDKVKYGMVKK